jgi:hypothetical protein
MSSFGSVKCRLRGAVVLAGMRILSLTLTMLLFTACGSKSSSSPAPAAPAPVEPAAPTARPTLSSADCAAQGGEVIGDIGDGAVHRPDYVCASGAPPMASISNTTGEAIAVEGSVCCKKQ